MFTGIIFLIILIISEASIAYLQSIMSRMLTYDAYEAMTYLRAWPRFTQRCDDTMREDPCVRPNVASPSALSGSSCHPNCQASRKLKRL